MKVSKQSRRAAKELFRECVSIGGLDEARVRRVVEAVIAGKPRGYIGILSHFQRLLKLEIQRRTARVETARPIDANVQATVREALSSAYGSGLDLSFIQTPSLIGGMRIRVGSDVYDGSVQGRLAALQESF